jgi:hypothetical protein
MAASGDGMINGLLRKSKIRNTQKYLTDRKCGPRRDDRTSTAVSKFWVACISIYDSTRVLRTDSYFKSVIIYISRCRALISFLAFRYPLGITIPAFERPYIINYRHNYTYPVIVPANC